MVDRETARRLRNARGIRAMIAMLLLALVALFLLLLLPSVTGSGKWDGIIGVILGLFISSLPSRHFLEILLYWKIEGRRFSTRRGRALWVAGNSVVLFAGWLVIVVGSMRFIPAR